MSLLMKHQKISKPIFQDGQTFQSSLSESFERENSSGENNRGVSNNLNDQKRKVTVSSSLKLSF